jgi:antitoxin HicB
MSSKQSTELLSLPVEMITMVTKDFDLVYEKELKKEFQIKLYPIKDDDGGETVWAAEIPELPGCVGAGDTPQEALLAVDDARKSWIEIALLEGKEIPTPFSGDALNYSGKFTLRLPKTLHKELAEKAEQEAVSLNQYLLYLISKRHYKTANLTTVSK